MSKLFKTLYGQVFAAILVGVLIGYFFPAFAVSLKPLGDGFIKLIKMLIAPIVFCVVVTGICGAENMKKVGRVGIKAIVYFEVMTTFALVIGILLAKGFGLGHGMNVDPRTLDTSSLSAYTGLVGKATNASDFILHIIPTTVFDAFTKGDVLQVLLFSIIFGFALFQLGDRAKPVTIFIDDVAHALFKAMGFIMKLAPLGVLGAMAFTVGKYGIGSLKHLGLLVIVFYASCTLFVTLLLGAVMRLAGFNIFRFLKYLRDELFIVFGTTSSEAVLPAVMQKLENMGIAGSTVGLVIPTGYSFNLDGFSIYLTMAAIFIAQATNTPVSLPELLAIIGVAVLTSKGAAGIPGSAIVVLAATLSAVHSIPPAGLALIIGIDWLMGIGRAVTNLIGNCVATVAIATWEKDIDKQCAHQVLSGETPACAYHSVQGGIEVVPQATETTGVSSIASAAQGIPAK